VNAVLLGLLLGRAAWAPTWLGGLLGVAGLVYLAGSFTRLVAPDLAAVIAPAYAVPILAESATCLWLLFFARPDPG
jgi:hypothetical protein